METLHSTFMKRPEFDQHTSDFKKLQEIVQQQAVKIRQLEQNAGRAGSNAAVNPGNYLRENRIN